MTQQMLRNLESLQDVLRNTGFGNKYDEPLALGIKSGQKELVLEAGFKNYGGNEWLRWEPKVGEGKDGRYYFNGFQATLVIDDEIKATNFFANRRMAGATADQARMLLTGGTIEMRMWLESRGEITPVYNKLQFPAEDAQTGIVPLLKKGERMPSLMVPADAVDFARLVSMEDFGTYNQQRKNAILKDLADGKVVNVIIQQRHEGGRTENLSVKMELYLGSKEEMSMIIMNSDGSLLRENKVPVQYNGMTEVKDLIVGTGNGLVPANILDKLATLDGDIRPDAQPVHQAAVRYRPGATSGQGRTPLPEGAGPNGEDTETGSKSKTTETGAKSQTDETEGKTQNKGKDDETVTRGSKVVKKVTEAKPPKVPGIGNRIN